MSFGVPTTVGPLCLVVSYIFNQAACLLHPTKPYQGVNFQYEHFLSAAHLNATELFQNWISEALQSQRLLARNLQLRDWDHDQDWFSTTPIK